MATYILQDYEIKRLHTHRCACYLIQYKGKWVLVDTSMPFERRRLVAQIEEVTGGCLEAIFITHNHSDHIGNGKWLSMHYHCPLYIHKESVEQVRIGRCAMPKGTNRRGRFIYHLEEMIKGLYDFCGYTPCKDALKLENVIVAKYLGESDMYSRHQDIQLIV